MNPNSSLAQRWLLVPSAVGLFSTVLLIGLYLAVVSLAQSPGRALNLFWENKFMLLPIALGFGLHAGLYTLFKKGYHQPFSMLHRNSVTTGASGGLSGTAMLACCAPALINTLPLLGFTVIATFLANWQMPFMIAALLSNAIGIGLLLHSILKNRQQVSAILSYLKQSRLSHSMGRSYPKI